MPRPPKLTPDVQQRIVDAVRNGNTRRIAAAVGGVDESTLYRWLERGNGPRAAKLYREFREAVYSAEATAVQTAVAAIRLAGVKGTWQAYAWWLERLHPGEFGRKDRVKLEVDQAAVAQITDVINRIVTDPDTLDALRAEFSRLSLEE